MADVHSKATRSYNTICGARTEIISDFFHTLKNLGVNECLNDNCKYVFLEVDEPL
jgi:hypothetical protein